MHACPTAMRADLRPWPDRSCTCTAEHSRASTPQASLRAPRPRPSCRSDSSGRRRRPGCPWQRPGSAPSPASRGVQSILHCVHCGKRSCGTVEGVQVDVERTYLPPSSSTGIGMRCPPRAPAAAATASQRCSSHGFLLPFRRSPGLATGCWRSQHSHSSARGHLASFAGCTASPSPALAALPTLTQTWGGLEAFTTLASSVDWMVGQICSGRAHAPAQACTRAGPCGQRQALLQAGRVAAQHCIRP